MLIDAEFNNGQIKFLQPLQFAHQYFRIKVDVPAEEILTEENQSDSMNQFEQLLDSLYSSIENTGTDKSDKELWRERMLEKHG
jgi:hypothetical protein